MQNNFETYYEDFPFIWKVKNPRNVLKISVSRWSLHLLSKDLTRERIDERSLETVTYRFARVALFDQAGRLISTVAKPVWYRPSTWEGPWDLTNETVGEELNRLGKKRQRVCFAVEYTPEGEMVIYKPPKERTIEQLYIDWISGSNTDNK